MALNKAKLPYIIHMPTGYTPSSSSFQAEFEDAMEKAIAGVTRYNKPFVVYAPVRIVTPVKVPPPVEIHEVGLELKVRRRAKSNSN